MPSKAVDSGHWHFKGCEGRQSCKLRHPSHRETQKPPLSVRQQLPDPHHPPGPPATTSVVVIAGQNLGAKEPRKFCSPMPGVKMPFTQGMCSQNANGKGSLPPLYGPRSSETGTVRGLRWHNFPRERNGVQGRPGREREGSLQRETVQGKGSGKWREANRRRPLQTAAQPGVMPNPPRRLRLQVQHCNRPPPNGSCCLCSVLSHFGRNGVEPSY